MLFSLGKLLQSLRDKQEQEESTKPFLAATSQVSWRNAALAEDASEKGGEDPGCSPYPTQYPAPQGLGSVAQLAAACRVGVPGCLVSLVLSLVPTVFSPVALLTSLPGVALIKGHR